MINDKKPVVSLTESLNEEADVYTRSECDNGHTDEHYTPAADIDSDPVPEGWS